MVEKLFSVVDPVHVGAAKRASELSSSVGERLLLMHMATSEEKPKAKQIAENLNKSFSLTAMRFPEQRLEGTPTENSRRGSGTLPG